MKADSIRLLPLGPLVGLFSSRVFSAGDYKESNTAALRDFRSHSQVKRAVLEENNSADATAAARRGAGERQRRDRAGLRLVHVLLPESELRASGHGMDTGLRKEPHVPAGPP